MNCPIFVYNAQLALKKPIFQCACAVSASLRTRQHPINNRQASSRPIFSPLAMTAVFPRNSATFKRRRVLIFSRAG